MSDIKPSSNNKQNEIDASADEIDYGLRMMNAIDVQYVDEDLYMSKELKINFTNKSIFGGQIVAQALHASWNTVAADFHAHVNKLFFICKPLFILF